MSKNPKYEFQGLDHLALVCSDMKATVDFYHHKLGLPILHTLEYQNDAGEVIGQHFFFGVGDPTNPEAHIAMFWWKDGYQTIPRDALPAYPKPKNTRAQPIGTFLHLNLRVAPEKIEEYCNKLKADKITFRHTVRYADTNRPGLLRAVTKTDEFVPMEDKALMTSVYMNDPDGYEVEFNAWTEAWKTWRNDHVPMSQAVPMAKAS